MWLATGRGRGERAQREPLLRKAAAANGIVIVAPIYELDAKAEKRFNTAVVIEADGPIVGKYRKTHIPAAPTSRASSPRPSTTAAAGARKTPHRPRSWAKSLLPRLQDLGRQGGRGHLLRPAFRRRRRGAGRGRSRAGVLAGVTFGAKSRRLWEQEFLVDACRHRLFIGGSNRKGSEKPWNQPYFGESYFAGPDGEKLENVSSRPELVIADLDLGAPRTPIRRAGTLKRDVRPDIY